MQIGRHGLKLFNRCADSSGLAVIGIGKRIAGCADLLQHLNNLISAKAGEFLDDDLAAFAQSLKCALANSVLDGGCNCLLCAGKLLHARALKVAAAFIEIKLLTAEADATKPLSASHGAAKRGGDRAQCLAKLAAKRQAHLFALIAATLIEHAARPGAAQSDIGKIVFTLNHGPHDAAQHRANDCAYWSGNRSNRAANRAASFRVALIAAKNACAYIPNRRADLRAGPNCPHASADAG